MDSKLYSKLNDVMIEIFENSEHEIKNVHDRWKKKL